MTRRFVVCAVLLSVFFTLPLSLMHLKLSSSGALAALSECAFPCWRGVQPGITPVQDAVTHFDTLNQFASFPSACQLAHPDRCQRYTWSPPGDQFLYTQLEVEAGQVGAVVAYNPGVTLGEAMTALSDLGVELDGVNANFVENDQFYTQVLFAHSHVIVEVLIACNATYADLLQTPIRTLEIDALQLDNHYVPIMSFGQMRRLFSAECAPALQ